MADRDLPPARPAASGPAWRSVRGLDVVVALALAAWVASTALLTGAFSDWELEAEPAALALQRGDLDAWAASLPAYGGGMTLRAPGMLLGGLVGGGLDWTYRFDGLTGLLALLGLGLLLAGAARRRASTAPLRTSTTVLLVLGLVVGGPLGVRALETGHPEELVGGALCVGAVLVAARRGDGRGGRAGDVLAGALLGLAVANKAWAVLAVLPVLAALPDTGSRGRGLLAAGVAGGLLLAPSMLLGGTHLTAVAATGAATIFKPQQLFYLLGEPGYTQPSPFGDIPGRREGPVWTGVVSHPLIVILGALLAAAWWVRTPRRGRDAANVLRVLAAILWWRCLLDTWNAEYYVVPAVVCLAAADAVRGRTPWAALLATALATATLVRAEQLGMSFDLRTVLHLLWAVPFGAWLVVGALRHEKGRPARAPAAQPTSTSSLASPVLSTRAPSSVTTTRSSIRTPQRPGT